MTPSGIITLTTDFGTEDAFVGMMKGVMLGVNPAARFIDLTHDIPPQDLYRAAFVVGGAWRWYPQGTVHLVVVDPGVGSSRAMVAAKCDGHLFVAPDNGVLTAVFDEADSVGVVSIENERYFLADVSRTFHGRDVFAPVAAHLSAGLDLCELGPALLHPIQLPIPRPRVEVEAVVGRVVYIDRFGNAISNIAEAAAKRVVGETVVSVSLDGGRLMFDRVSESYAEVEEGEAVVLFNSFGLLECAVRNGDAADVLGLHVGLEFTISRG